MKITFTEKYRPRVFDQVLGQDTHIEKFKAMVTTGAMPHLLLYGIRGTGKTTCARIFVDLMGAESITLNASNERGIDVIRYQVQRFMSTLSAGKKSKILIFEEADQLTGAAQEALKAMMEQYEGNCRIIFLCNHPERIIKEIKSRCSVYEFRPIPSDVAKAFIKAVAQKESVPITPQALTLLIDRANGDLRKALRILQDLSILGRKITVGDVGNQYDDIELLFDKTMASLKNKRVKEACKNVHKYLQTTGLAPRRFIEMFHGYILTLEEFNPEWLIGIADADIRITLGGTDIVHIDALLAGMST
jgi:replication factor C small subunit